jgi:hypothetical protein
MNNPIIQETFFWLQFSSLFLVVLLLIVLIVATIIVLSMIKKLGKKSEDLIDSLKEKSSNFIDKTEVALLNITDLSSIIASFVGWKKRKTMFDILVSFLKK